MVGSRFSTTMGRGFAMGVSLAQSSKPGRVDVAARVDRGGQRTATRKSAYRLHRVYAPERPRVPGLLKTDLGIIDEVTIGTYPLPWLAFPLLKSTIPNVYAKVRSPWSGPLTLAIAGSFLFVDGKAIAQLADKSASASAISTTAEFDASYRFDHRFSLSVGLDYARLRAVGGKDDEATSVEGASSGHTYSTRLLGEWRLSRVFALSLLFRYLIYQSPINVDTSSSDSAVTVTS